MGNQSSTVVETLNRSDCIKWAASLLGAARTWFGVSQLTFATEVADKAEDFYLSRYRVRVKEALPSDQLLEVEMMWHIALMSNLQLFNSVSYEDVLNKYDAEIASYLFLVNPDMRMPVFERTRRYLTNLYNGTNLAKLIVLTRQIVTINMIGEAAPDKNPDALYELAECLKQLKPVANWSKKMLDEWNHCKHIVNAWGFQNLVPVRCKKPYLSWNLDFTKTQNDLKQLFELD